MKLFKIVIYLVLSLFILFNIYLCSYSVVHGEVNFFNDVARDFLLLQEVSQKKIIFIGPRSNTQGLFHGPLWTYVNFPVYVLGNGNPVAQAWFWLILAIAVMVGGFFMARKLFGNFAAFAYVLLLSIRFVPHINGVFHSEATLFLMPSLFFTALLYVQKKKLLYLVLHLITLSALFQFNIGNGIPFFMLSVPLILLVILKNKLWKQLGAFLIVPVLFVNFILFDVKHNFQMTKALFSAGSSTTFFVAIDFWIKNRIENTISLQLFEKSGDHMLLLYVIFALIVFFSIKEIRNKKSKHRNLYGLFLYYYLGYMALSFLNRGVLLYHYIYLLIPLTIFWFVSFLRGKYKFIFVPLLLVVFFINFNYSREYVTTLTESMAKNQNSWKGMSRIAQTIIKEQNGREFGYFVFSPDSYAYQPRYAMIYNFKAAHAKAFEYGKKDTTYVIAAPSPEGKYYNYPWWVKNRMHVEKEPVATQEFSTGFTLAKYELSSDEQKVTHDKAIELGISAR